MEPVRFLEVLDRRGRVTQRVRLDTLPATVGRGYGNTVIVDDRYVAAEHLRLEATDDGGVEAVDQRSENGLYAVGHPRRVARVRLTPGGRIRIGHTVLRFATADQAVPPAVPEPFAGHRLGRVILSTRGAGLIVAAAVAAQMLSSWLGMFREPAPERLLSDGLLALFVLGCWAGAWALATRWRAPGGMFLTHLAVVSAAALGGDLLQAVFGYVRAAAPDLAASSLGVLGGSANVLLGAGLLYAHLALASGLDAGRRAAWALGLVLSLVGAVRFVTFAERNRTPLGVDFSATLRPLPPSLVRSTAVEPFLAELTRLQERVDTLANQPR